MKRRNRTWSHLTGPWRGGVEDLGLHIGRQVGVDGEDQQLGDLGSQPPASLLEQLATGFDLLLPDAHVTGREASESNSTRGHTSQ